MTLIILLFFYAIVFNHWTGILESVLYMDNVIQIAGFRAFVNCEGGSDIFFWVDSCVNANVSFGAHN